jgi:hypothetical protein
VLLPALNEFDQTALTGVVGLVGDLREAFPELKNFTVEFTPMKYAHATRLSSRRGNTIRVHDGLVAPGTTAAFQQLRDDAQSRGIVVKADRPAACVAVAEKAYGLVEDLMGAEYLRGTATRRYVKYALFASGGALLFSPPVGAAYGAGLASLDHLAKNKVVRNTVEKAAFADEMARRLEQVPRGRSTSFLTRAGYERHQLMSSVSSKAAAGNLAEELFVGVWCNEKPSGAYANLATLYRRTRDSNEPPAPDFSLPTRRGGGRPAI